MDEDAFKPMAFEEPATRNNARINPWSNKSGTTAAPNKYVADMPDLGLITESNGRGSFVLLDDKINPIDEIVAKRFPPDRGLDTCGHMEGITRRTCPQGHALARCHTMGNWECADRNASGWCKSGNPIFYNSKAAAINRFRCDQCAYDLCQKCFGAEEKTCGSGEQQPAAAPAGGLAAARGKWQQFCEEETGGSGEQRPADDTSIDAAAAAQASSAHAAAQASIAQAAAAARAARERGNGSAAQASDAPAEASSDLLKLEA